MSIHRTLLVIVGLVVIASLSLRFARPASAQTSPRAEEVAVFSVCTQAPDAARDVQTKVNAWFDNHRGVRVLQREMFTAACPGATEYGSVAITIAIHYQP